tara:strand:- start:11015 stop:11242 length:228 start_codon:yes stop_codon:yes gene_type:complete
MKDKVTEALDFLESEGYFVYNLWHVQDVQNNFECTNEEAQEVLEGVLTNDWLMGQINAGINQEAEVLNLKHIDDE